MGIDVGTLQGFGATIGVYPEAARNWKDFLTKNVKDTDLLSYLISDGESFECAELEAMFPNLVFDKAGIFTAGEFYTVVVKGTYLNSIK